MIKLTHELRGAMDVEVIQVEMYRALFPPLESNREPLHLDRAGAVGSTTLSNPRGRMHFAVFAEIVRQMSTCQNSYPYLYIGHGCRNIELAVSSSSFSPLDRIIFEALNVQIVESSFITGSTFVFAPSRDQDVVLPIIRADPAVYLGPSLLTMATDASEEDKQVLTNYASGCIDTSEPSQCLTINIRSRPLKNDTSNAPQTSGLAYSLNSFASSFMGLFFPNAPESSNWFLLKVGAACRDRFGESRHSKSGHIEDGDPNNVAG